MADQFALIKRPRHLAYSVAFMPVLALIQFAAYWLRFDGQLGAAEMQVLWSTLVWAILIKTAAFTWFGIYQSWDSYVSFHDLVSLCKAATLSSVLLAMGDYLFLSEVLVPR